MVISPKAGLAAVAALMLLATGCTPSGERALVEGDRLLREGKTVEAVRMIEHAVETLPQNARALNQLGLAYQTAGRDDEARRAYLRALDLDRNLFEANHNLALLYESKSEWLEAERALRTYLAAQPEDGVAWARLGSIQFRAGRLDDAERSLASAKKFEAAGADEWNTLGLISVQKKRFREARDRFLWAQKISPSHGPALLNLAILHQQQLGDPRGALGYYRAWLAASPGGPEAASVAEIVRQLEARFGLNQPVRAEPTNAPPRLSAVATNPPPAIPRTGPPPVVAHTNPPVPAPAPRTNTVLRAGPGTAAAAPVRTNPVPTVVSAPSNPPPATPAAPRPQEIVRVEDDAPLLAARDTQAAPSATRHAETAPAVPASAVPVPAVPDPAPARPETIPNPALTVVAEPAEKKSVWKRVNPVNWANPVKWFRKDPAQKDGEAPVEPQQVRPVATVTPSTPKPTPRPEPAQPVTPVPLTRPERPAPPRYVPRATGTLQPGNRAAADAEFALAADAHRRHDLDGAAAGYRRTTALDPTHFEAHHNLALVALDQGDLPLALLACEHALQLRPGELETRRTFALALRQAGNTADAADQLEEILAVRPADAALHLAAAGLYAGDLDDIRRARRHYDAVLAIEPGHPQAVAIRSWLASNPAP